MRRFPDPNPLSRRADCSRRRNPPLGEYEQEGCGFHLRSASLGEKVACNPPYRIRPNFEKYLYLPVSATSRTLGNLQHRNSDFDAHGRQCQLADTRVAPISTNPRRPIATPYSRTSPIQDLEISARPADAPKHSTKTQHRPAANWPQLRLICNCFQSQSDKIFSSSAS